MQVLDNYLEHQTFLALKAAILSPLFPWEKAPILSEAATGDLLPADNLQFVHGFYQKKPGYYFQSPTLSLLKPLLDKLAPKSLVKIKANRTPRKDRHIEYGLHVDTKRVNATTAIYYLNTNNGYTRFADGQRIKSVENRLVLFDATTPHTGASCTDEEERLVLNINIVLSKHQRQYSASPTTTASIADS